jgi:hypothetical protein
MEESTIHAGLRHGLLGAAGLGPLEVQVGPVLVLEELDFEVVRPTRGQLDRLRGLFLLPVVDPVVDDGLSVDPEKEPDVPDHREHIGTGLLRHDLPGPPHAHVVGLPGGRAQPRFEGGKVDVRIEPRGLELPEVEGTGGGLDVVLALQAMHLGGTSGVRRRGRGRNCGQPGGAESGGEKQDRFLSDAHGSSLMRKGGGSLHQHVQR